MFNHKMETVKQQIAKIITVIFGIKLILHDIRLKKMTSAEISRNPTRVTFLWSFKLSFGQSSAKQLCSQLPVY